MTDSFRTLILLSPAFPREGPESTWVYSQQLMVKTLRKLYPQIQVVVLALFYPDQSLSYFWEGAKVISFDGLKQNKWRRAFLWIKIWKTMRNIGRSEGIGGIISFWCGECALLGTYFARCYGIRHYIWICGQDARKSNRYVRIIRPRADELVAMSRFLAAEFHKNHGINPSHLIPNGIEPAQFNAPGVPERDIDILAVGSLEPLKRYSLFVDILATLKDAIPGIRAVLCGQGTEHKTLEDLTRSRGLERVLELRGLTPHQEVISLMRRSKIFLHTSDYEGLSTVCLEALYAGAHVISFCDPMQGSIPHWHLVHTSSEMTHKAMELLLSHATEYIPVMTFSMLDSARAFVHLVYGVSVKDQNIAFYDAIAGLYNKTMEKDPANRIIRRIVQQKLDRFVPAGRVMDFGGGTGLDLEWLSARRSVIFCEPSERMREVAVALGQTMPHSSRITFLDSPQTDYTRWQEARPFSGEVDAILCNFGVINYIPDLEELFSRLTIVLKPGGHLFILALKYGFIKRFRQHRSRAVAVLFTRRSFILDIPGENGIQRVAIHTPGEIGCACRKSFTIRTCDILGINDFMLIHLVSI